MVLDTNVMNDSDDKLTKLFKTIETMRYTLFISLTLIAIVAGSPQSDARERIPAPHVLKSMGLRRVGQGTEARLVPLNTAQTHARARQHGLSWVKPHDVTKKTNDGKETTLRVGGYLRAQRGASIKMMIDGKIQSLTPHEFQQKFGVVWAPHLLLSAQLPESVWRYRFGSESSWLYRQDRRFIEAISSQEDDPASIVNESRRTKREQKKNINDWSTYAYESLREDGDIATVLHALLPPSEINRLYAAQIRNAHVADVHIRHISDAVGFGLFASSDIESEALIGEYTGVAMPAEQAQRTHSSYKFGAETKGISLVDAKRFGNYTRFINHSEKNANCTPAYVPVDGIMHIVLVATRKISAGEQILFDYGAAYWKDKPGIVPVEF